MWWAGTMGRVVAAGLMFVAALAAGCAELRLPRIDPSGQRLFLPPPEPAHPRFKNVPGAPRPWDTVELILTPRSTIAPVGSEVVLMAGVRGPDQHLRTNERVEWSIAPGGVGQFVDFDRGSCWDLLVGDFNCPRKLTPTFVVTSTSRRYLRLTRGTPTPSDDLLVNRGQTYVTLTSAVEGTSYVTAYAPDVFGWDQRMQTAVVHWVDAQWRFPPPAINPAGSRHVLTTLVMRQSDQQPCVGWRVQYSIVDGPAAGFSPSGAAAIEVETDAAGQASAEIVQPQPAPGTNRIAIQVIRPGQPGSPWPARLVVGSGWTSKTWSAPGLSVRKSGPTSASVGATIIYRIELANSGDMPAEAVVLTDEVPEELSYMGSTPPGQLTGRTVQWQLGRLGPGERRVVEVSLRGERAGSVTSCAEAIAAGGLRAKDCVSTSIGLAVPQPAPAPGAACVGPPPTAPPPLDVRVVGPERVYVGDTVTFEIIVTNRGASRATGIVIKDRFDPGLVHPTLSSPIRRLLGEDLAPGQSRRIGVEFRAAKAGLLCHDVEVTADGGIVARARGCVTAVDRGLPSPTTPPPAPGPSAPAPGPSGLAPPPTAGAPLSVTLRAPQTASLGDDVDMFIDLVNTGTQPLTDLKVFSTMDLALEPYRANESPAGSEGDALYWSLPRLAPGDKKTYRILCKCQQEAARACHRVKVTASQIAPIQQEACLAIVPAGPSRLNLSITSLHGDIAVGKELTYVIRVANNGRADEADVVVTAEVPPEMIPVRLGTTGPTRPDFKGQTVQFAPLERLAAGGTQEYRLRVQARQPGEVTVRAKLTSRAQRQPILAEARTTILKSP